jgi:hypothetical protein
MNPNQPQIDLTKTTPVTDGNGNHVFTQGVILRRISKFLLGSDEDGIIPIPVFINPEGEILTEMLPKEIREEYEKPKITI